MTSKACCEVAPVSADYTTKGEYEEIAGVRSYVVGPENATKGIVDIYDIFGITNQTLQGADRFSALTGAVVVVPDFFNGTALDHSLVPADTDEKKAAIGAFMGGTANMVNNGAKLVAIRKALSARFPAAEGHWGVFGLCWGGKLAVLACKEDNHGEGRRFNVSGTAHPGMLEEADATAQTAPHILLASKDEPAEAVAMYKRVLGEKGEVETYEGMHHGWMGARADLNNEENAKEYVRGYGQAAEFFSKHL